MKFLFMRHAQSQKNLIGMPGGDGMPLTELGRSQALIAADELSALKPAIDIVYASPHVQTKETASIVSETLDLPSGVADDFTSIGLGRLSGVSISNAEREFSQDSSEMQRWRDGIAPISELRIEGMEPPNSFGSRSIAALSRLKHTSKEARKVLVVCTTSHLIFFRHLSNEVSPMDSAYKNIEFQFCEHFETDYSLLVSTWLSLIRG